MKIKTSVLWTVGFMTWGLVARAENPTPTAPSTTATPAAATAPATEKMPLKVDIQLGTGIENHELTGAADSFDIGVGAVVGWTRVEGAQEPTQISHIWIYKGNEIASVPLAVKASPYRTHSRKTITGFPGSWVFQVKDAEGNVLGEKKFEVTASAEAPATETK